MSSSVSLPHCSLTLPFTCFQLPSMRSQFMCIPFKSNSRTQTTVKGLQGTGPALATHAKRGYAGGMKFIAASLLAMTLVPGGLAFAQNAEKAPEPKKEEPQITVKGAKTEE